MSLGLRVTVRSLLFLVLAVGIVFLPAGSFRFWQGWAFLTAMFLPVVFLFAYFLRHDRALLERRLRDNEPVKEQKWLIRLFVPFFLAAFLLPGFDHRLGWSRRLVGEVPVWLTVISLGLVAGGLLFVWWVLKVNSYAGRTVQVDAGQTVISAGPYARVRHPMYSGCVVLWAFAPLALGSWVAVPAFWLLIPFYAIRLLNEEKVLRAELAGYSEYCLKTRFHLIPFVW
ncbi:MAG: isoprenylcysteine carboxylmethyltransferase family protein [Terracidiphilus sp.]|jgi:protein-S-isoprenylcysteine O-methyltransferase Ste14